MTWEPTLELIEGCSGAVGGWLRQGTSQKIVAREVLKEAVASGALVPREELQGYVDNELKIRDLIPAERLERAFVEHTICETHNRILVLDGDEFEMPECIGFDREDGRMCKGARLYRIKADSETEGKSE